MNRISTCPGCRAKESGLKSRIAIPHTCGLEPGSARTKRGWLPDPPVENDVDPLTDDVKRFYEIFDEDQESIETPKNHNWEEHWHKEQLSFIDRATGVIRSETRKCKVCGATQFRDTYKSRPFIRYKVVRNGRSNVDCNPELASKTHNK